MGFLTCFKGDSPGIVPFLYQKRMKIQPPLPGGSAFHGTAGASNWSTKTEEAIMADNSVYKIIELVGTSSESWEAAAKEAVERAGESLRDLRIAEISKLDMKVEEGRVAAFRARVKLSFKYGGS